MPQSSQEKGRKERLKRRVLLNSLKLASGCVDCGYDEDPVALDFDHRDPGQKAFTIAEAGTVALSLLLLELAKCDVRCANCHRVKTHRQAGGPDAGTMETEGDEEPVS